MKRFLITLQCVVILTGCAAQDMKHPATRDRVTRGQIVDYDGNVCHEQNMHVKMPACFLPHMSTTWYSDGPRHRLCD
jgi:hypothetical protein